MRRWPVGCGLYLCGFQRLCVVKPSHGTMDADKMADEKFEHRKGSMVEDGFGGGDVDVAVVKRTLWKMDIR